MKQYQRKIKEYKSLIQKEYIQETAVCTVMERCSDIVSRQEKMVGPAGRNPVSALDSAGGLRWRSKYRADTGGYVGDVFCDDRT